jgi:hypothetical protein
MSEGRPGPLDGVRVLDLTRVVAGPYCSMFLGDLGAEVVKVEQPGAGDDTRGWGPPFAGGESAYFLCINRNKQSLTLDLKSKRAVELLRDLVKVADVIIENFRPGTMERLGLGEKELRALNPRLIYASLTGFGVDGPMSDWPGYDLIVQAWGGLMSITGTPEGEPVKVGVAIIDLDVFARSRSRGADQRRQQLPRRRQDSDPLGQRPSEHRALSEFQNRRRLSSHRRRQRSDLETLLPGDRPRGFNRQWPLRK